MALKGLTDAETDALRLVSSLTPWKRDRISKAVGRYLDGDEHALDKMPTLRQRIDDAVGRLDAERRRQAAYEAAKLARKHRAQAEQLEAQDNALLEG